jgi:hypothetical protein
MKLIHFSTNFKNCFKKFCKNHTFSQVLLRLIINDVFLFDFSAQNVYLRKKSANHFYFLPDSLGKMHGNGRSDLEDLAFSNRPPKEADEIGRRVCMST